MQISVAKRWVKILQKLKSCLGSGAPGRHHHNCNELRQKAKVRATDVFFHLNYYDEIAVQA